MLLTRPHKTYKTFAMFSKRINYFVSTYYSYNLNKDLIKMELIKENVEEPSTFVRNTITNLNLHSNSCHCTSLSSPQTQQSKYVLIAAWNV